MDQPHASSGREGAKIKSMPHWAYKDILGQLQEGIIIVSADGSYRHMNKTAAQLYGFRDPADFMEQFPRLAKLLEVRTYPDRQLLTPGEWPIAQLQKGIKHVHSELYVKRLDTNKEIIIEYTGKIIRGQRDDMPFVVLTLRDITEQKITTQATDRQAAFFKTALDAIITIDHVGTVIEFNPAAEQIFGYSQSEAIGHEMAELIIPHHLRDAHRKGIANFLQTDTGPLIGKRVEVTAARRNGEIFPVELFISRIGASNPPTFMGTLRDITERKLNEERLIESEARFRTMSDTAPVLIWMSDTSKACTWFNKPWLRFTGRSLKQELGDGWMKGVHPDDLKQYMETYITSSDNRQDFHMEYRLRRNDGQYRWMLDSGTPRYAPDGAFLGYIGSCMDITETKQLRRETAELVEINRAKDEFIALASHQLRTPATGVKQYVGMLLQGYGGELDGQQTDLLQTAYDSNERQLDVINALLNVAQLDAGKVALKRVPCRIDHLLRDIIKEQAETFQVRHQSLTAHMPAKPVTASIDRRLIRMVLENIIDNAGKYTPWHKTITIHLASTAKLVTIAVSDQGVGISKRDQAKLFQKFSRIDNDLSTLANGSGLGLYWAKKILDLHDATISVNSKARQGSTFTVSLPKTHRAVS
jgi:PAS domain S-box-containing protein